MAIKVLMADINIRREKTSVPGGSFTPTDQVHPLQAASRRHVDPGAIALVITF